MDYISNHSNHSINRNRIYEMNDRNDSKKGHSINSMSNALITNYHCPIYAFELDELSYRTKHFISNIQSKWHACIFVERPRLSKQNQKRLPNPSISLIWTFQLHCIPFSLRLAQSLDSLSLALSHIIQNGIYSLYVII